MSTAVLALGANLGDRLAALQAAVDAFDTLAASAVYESVAVGPEQPDYLNAAILVGWTGSPRALLDACHAVEDALGRVRERRWGPRTLDVDVVTAGDLELDGPDLVVPHPRAAGRAFVLLPWLDVEPGAVLPDGRKVADVLATLDRSGVRRRDDLVLRLAP